MKRQQKASRRADYDSPWKDALDRYFEPFMALFFPDAHAQIDWSRGYEALDKELHQVVREAELGRRVVDKLFRVWRTSGDEEWVLIHIEVQAEQEAEFERRMFVYHYRLFDRYNRAVVSLAVLADDKPGWRPARFGYELWNCGVAFWFPSVKLLDWATDDAALERSPNPIAAVVLAQREGTSDRDRCRGTAALETAARQGTVSARVESRGRSGVVSIDGLADGTPAGVGTTVSARCDRYEEEYRMPYITSMERLAMAEGRAEGRAEGLREGLLTGIELSLKLKFKRAGRQLLPEIRQLTNPKKLRAVQRAIAKASTLDEVRRLLG